MVSRQLLVIEPELEAQICGANEDADLVFDFEVVLAERPEVAVLFGEFLFVGGGEVGGDFAEDASGWDS